MSDQLSILPGLGTGNYRIELDGQQIGHVRRRSLLGYRSEYYWDAFDLDSEGDDGRRVPGACVARGCSRRRDAVASLVAHYNHERNQS